MAKTIIMWPDNNFDFTEKAKQKVIELWNNNTDLADIAKSVRQGNLEETLLFVLYLLYQREIQPRAKAIIIGGVQ